MEGAPMRRWSLLELYALLVCLGMLIWFIVALYFLGYGVVACEAPEYTVNRWDYHSHQTNERYWKYANLGDRRPRLSEDALTAERERSWQAVLLIERRYGTWSMVQSGFGLVVSAVVFWVHWRIARRTRREDREAEGTTAQRPFVLAGAIILVLGSCFSCGLVLGLTTATLVSHRMRYDEECRSVVPILAADPAFTEVELREQSAGGITLSGVVPAEADLERLRGQVARALGERRGKEVTRGVSVRLDVPSER
jgi:hypothetical protein